MRNWINIVEARRNPEKNPRGNINQELIDIISDESVYTDRIGSTINAFVQFADIQKFGIYPMSTYRTPTGIYTYPLEYLVKEKGLDKLMSANTSDQRYITFAGNKPYANVFSADPATTINIATLTDDQQEEYIKRISKFMGRKANNDAQILRGMWDAMNGARIKTPGGKLWAITRQICQRVRKLKTGSSSTQYRDWAWLWRNIGVTGCIDIDPANNNLGHGIIHPNEPTQAVFFDTSKTEFITRVRNVFYSEELAQQTQDRYASDQVSVDDFNEMRSQDNLGILHALFKFRENNRAIRLIKSDQSIRREVSQISYSDFQNFVKDFEGVRDMYGRETSEPIQFIATLLVFLPHRLTHEILKILAGYNMNYALNTRYIRELVRIFDGDPSFDSSVALSLYSNKMTGPESLYTIVKNFPQYLERYLETSAEIDNEYHNNSRLQGLLINMLRRHPEIWPRITDTADFEDLYQSKRLMQRYLLIGTESDIRLVRFLNDTPPYEIQLKALEHDPTLLTYLSSLDARIQFKVAQMIRTASDSDKDELIQILSGRKIDARVVKFIKEFDPSIIDYIT